MTNVSFGKTHGPHCSLEKQFLSIEQHFYYTTCTTLDLKITKWLEHDFMIQWLKLFPGQSESTILDESMI